MFTGKDALSVDELLVKLRKWQLGRQTSVLDVEQPEVTCSKPTRFGAPCFCPRIRRVNADVNDLRNFEAPIAYDLNRSRSQAGSAMILTATDISSERAN